jgi:hypothetical protein
LPVASSRTVATPVMVMMDAIGALHWPSATPRYPVGNGAYDS